MEVKKLKSIGAYQQSSLVMQVFNNAVEKAKEINTKNGLPNDFVINGKTYYQLPNGKITDKNPLEDK